MNQGSTSSSDLEVRPVAGSKPATDAALSDLRQRLVRFAVRMIWNRDDAEEIVQDAFKLALTKDAAPRLAHERYEPWMFRTVSNLCLNRRRRRKPEPLAERIDLPDTAAVDMRLHRAEQLERLRDAIDELPDQQRTALVLRTMQQMSYTDVAEVMSLTVAAVRSNVHFARRRLATLLGPDAPEAAS